MKKQHFLLTLLCLCAFSFMRAQVYYEVENLPSPKVYGQDFYVSNPDKVVSIETEQQINQLCTRLEQATEVELAVVVVDEFEKGRQTYSFALELFNYWGIGKADKNTGVLLFLSSGRRDVQIITGSGIEGVLTDVTCGDILDANIDYLSDNDFDNGLIAICKDIEDHLMSDEARAELLLGWAPASTDGDYFMMLYLILGFLTLAMMAFFGYKRLQGKPGQTKSELQQQSSGVKSTSGCLAVLFPLPMLFFYLYYLLARKRIKSLPFNCPKCGKVMSILPADDPRRKLNDIQRKEEQLQSREYEVWICPDCGETITKQLKGQKHFYFDHCPECGAEAMETTKRDVVRAATYSHSGTQNNTLVCACCGHKIIKSLYLPPLERPGSFTSSVLRGEGGGSSSGSWGGGRSSGGGAGRHF